jgi:hypothetical protein
MNYFPEKIIEQFSQLDRHTEWMEVDSTPFDFKTFHPQGLVFVNEKTFLSSVEVLTWPTRNERDVFITSGEGVGHVFITNHSGHLIHDVQVSEGSMYHPGGIDFDGDHIWIPVCEYRPDGKSFIATLDPRTNKLVKRFNVNDAIGWVVADPEKMLVYGGNWGSRLLYTWDHNGKIINLWKNPSSFIDYQDCTFIGDGKVVASGISSIKQAKLQKNSVDSFELGGFALLDFSTHTIVHEFPLQMYSKANNSLARNPFNFAFGKEGISIYVAPDDGEDIGGTVLLNFIPQN